MKDSLLNQSEWREKGQQKLLISVSIKNHLRVIDTWIFNRMAFLKTALNFNKYSPKFITLILLNQETVWVKMKVK
jgi:hypothetical protein